MSSSNKLIYPVDVANSDSPGWFSDASVLNITSRQFASMVGVALSTFLDWVETPNHRYHHVTLVPHRPKNPAAKRTEYLWNKNGAIEWAMHWTDDLYTKRQERKLEKAS